LPGEVVFQEAKGLETGFVLVSIFPDKPKELLARRRGRARRLLGTERKTSWMWWRLRVPVRAFHEDVSLDSHTTEALLLASKFYRHQFAFAG